LKVEKVRKNHLRLRMKKRKILFGLIDGGRYIVVTPPHRRRGRKVVVQGAGKPVADQRNVGVCARDVILSGGKKVAGLRQKCNARGSGC